MTDPCPICGRDRVLVGRAHNCRPSKTLICVRASDVPLKSPGVEIKKPERKKRKGK